MDIEIKLKHMIEQATKEKSHYYVGSTCRDALAEIKQLKSDKALLVESMKVLGFEIFAECDRDYMINSIEKTLKQIGENNET